MCNTYAIHVCTCIPSGSSQSWWGLSPNLIILLSMDGQYLKRLPWQQTTPQFHSPWPCDFLHHVSVEMLIFRYYLMRLWICVRHVTRYLSTGQCHSVVLVEEWEWNWFIVRWMYFHVSVIDCASIQSWWSTWYSVTLISWTYTLNTNSPPLSLSLSLSLTSF